MKKLTTFIFLLFIVFNCLGQTDIKNSVAEHYKTKEFDIAIFPENYKIYGSFKRFTPTKAEIKKAEQHLNSDLKELNSKLFAQRISPIIHENLRKYKRQYFGYLNEKGEKILLINCFWGKELKDDWLDRKVMVLDGGSYYWEVSFNLQTDQLFNLSIHGDA